MADAASPTPTDPRDAVIRRALDVAGAAAEKAGLRGEFLILAIAIPALIDAGLLSLSGDSTQGQGDVDPDAVRLPTYTVLRADLIGKAGFRISGLTGTPALESPTREITHQIADAVLPMDYVAQLNAERGRLYRAVDGQGSLRSDASGTPTETGEVP